MTRPPRLAGRIGPLVAVPLLALLLSACLIESPQQIAPSATPPSPSAPASSPAALAPSVAPQPSSTAPSPVAKRQYELVNKETLVLVKEEGLPPTEENKQRAAALGVEWTREGEVTVTAKAEHGGQTNVMKVKMVWTPLPSTITEGDVLPVEFVMDVLENKCPTMGLGAIMNMGVRFGPWLVGSESGNPVMADKNTPVGTQIKASVKEPVAGGGETMVIGVLAKGEQAGGVQYHYHYRLKK